MKPGKMHYLLWGFPRRDRKLRYAWCDRWVLADRVSQTISDVTCKTCQQILIRLA